MEVAAVKCSLECKEGLKASAVISDSRWGNYDECNYNELQELRILHFLVRNNNIINESDCFDNCLLNTKLEQYGLRLY